MNNDLKHICWIVCAQVKKKMKMAHKLSGNCRVDIHVRPVSTVVLLDGRQNGAKFIIT